MKSFDHMHIELETDDIAIKSPGKMIDNIKDNVNNLK